MSFENIRIARGHFGAERFQQFFFRGEIRERKDFFPAGAVGQRNDDDRIVGPVGIGEFIAGGTEGLDIELETAHVGESHAGEQPQIVLDEELLGQIAEQPERRVGLSAGKPGGLLEHGDRFVILFRIVEFRLEPENARPGQGGHADPRMIGGKSFESGEQERMKRQSPPFNGIVFPADEYCRSSVFGRFRGHDPVKLISHKIPSFPPVGM